MLCPLIRYVIHCIIRFSSFRKRNKLFPTLIAASAGCAVNSRLLREELSSDLFVDYIRHHDALPAEGTYLSPACHASAAPCLLIRRQWLLLGLQFCACFL